jgi:hypothetical protein
MFHMSDPTYGIIAIKFFEIHFMDFMPHLSHRFTNKWVRVKAHGIGLFNSAFLGQLVLTLITLVYLHELGQLV